MDEKSNYRELLEAITQLRDGWGRTEFPDEQTANSMQLDLARVLAPFEAPDLDDTHRQ